MNKTNGNMYSYIDRTYNPIKGICNHDCVYCYMKSMRRRFRQDATLRLDEKELKVALGSGQFFFVGSSTDVFAHNVPSVWITSVLNHLYEFPDNIYQLQSKNPKRFLEFVNHPLFQNKNRVVFCTTLESDIDHIGVSQAPAIMDRVTENVSAKEISANVANSNLEALAALGDMMLRRGIVREAVVWYNETAIRASSMAWGG